MIYIPVVCARKGPDGMFPYAFCLKPTRDPKEAWAAVVEDANDFIEQVKEYMEEDAEYSIDCDPLEKFLWAEAGEEVRYYEVNFFPEDDANHPPECDLAP